MNFITDGLGNSRWVDSYGIQIPDEAVVRWEEAEQTLRDQFAMAALQGMWAREIGQYSDAPTDLEMAQRAYRAADAMLEARTQEGKDGSA